MVLRDSSRIRQPTGPTVGGRVRIALEAEQLMIVTGCAVSWCRSAMAGYYAVMVRTHGKLLRCHDGRMRTHGKLLRCLLRTLPVRFTGRASRFFALLVF